MKSKRTSKQHRSSEKNIFSLTCSAGRFLLVGQILLVLSLCHFAAMLTGEGRAEALLYIDAYASSLSATFVILWGTALGLDLLERKGMNP